MQQIPPGRFVWHDLATTDPESAKSFYTDIIPWTTQPWDEDSDYTMFAANDAPIGGVTKLSDEVTSRGTPPHWTPSVYVYDVDSCVRQVPKLGGQVILAPREIPNVGSWAMIADPQGVEISLFEPTQSPPGHPGKPHRGEFSWHELTTTDYKAAWEFYRQLFNWEKVNEFDMGEMGMYHIFGQKGEQYGGMMNRPPHVPESSWMSYVRVDDVKPLADKVKQKGGAVMVEPMEVPGGDWITICKDPQGAAFALHSMKM